NLFDEAPTPLARRLVQPPSITVEPSDNSYLAIVGFEAARDQDVVEAGLRLVAEHRAAAQADPLGEQRAKSLASAFPARRAPDRIAFAGDADALCDIAGPSCLADSARRGEEIREMLDANAVLVARYESIQRMSGYANTAAVDVYRWLLAPSSFHATFNLLLARAALDAQHSHLDRALDFLARDMAFWRRVMASGSPLVDVQIAARAFTSEVGLLSEIIAAPSIDIAPRAARLRAMLAPLQADEFDLSRTLEREFEVRALTLSDLGALARRSPAEALPEAVPHWLVPLLYKRQATVNRTAALYERMQLVAHARPGEFERRRTELDAFVREQEDPDYHWIYDPVGKAVSASTPLLIDAIAASFDLAAYVNLVRASLELRLAAVGDADVEIFLLRAAPETRNPYSGLPFSWDPNTRTLSFGAASAASRDLGITEVRLVR
ncbi:MAG TPA: hypothetical protein VMV45_07300, partial [Casimicrobiaceae bacterium]|nr:hypothetical protein [Casimicrobiaceae bacterium]